MDQPNLPNKPYLDFQLLYVLCIYEQHPKITKNYLSSLLNKKNIFRFKSKHVLNKTKTKAYFRYRFKHVLNKTKQKPISDIGLKIVLIKLKQIRISDIL